jgi:hypothetical protein
MKVLGSGEPGTAKWGLLKLKLLTESDNRDWVLEYSEVWLARDFFLKKEITLFGKNFRRMTWVWKVFEK